MNAARLHYRIDGSGPPILLLHPVGLDLTFFDALVEELDPEYRILRVDLPGHGESPAREGSPDLRDYAADVRELMREIGYPAAAVIGFSFGGMIAQTLALEYPREVTALVAAACPSTLPDEARAALAERGKPALREGMAAVVDSTLERWFSESFRNRGGDQPARQRLLSDNAASWAQAWKAISKIDTAPRLHLVQVPALCLAGEEDRSAPPRVLEAMAKGIPGAQFAVIPGAPHMMFIEQPKETAQAISSLLLRAVPEVL